MTGFGAEASVLGRPDLGYMTMTEVASHAGNIASALGIPLIADADNGFGGVLSVMRTVQEFEGRGIAGIHIEDQALPKKCVYLGKVEVVSRDVYTSKIRAAVEARRDPSFLIVARIDAYESLGFAEVISRAGAAVDAGADMVFVMNDYLMTERERAELHALVPAPLFGVIGGVRPTGIAAPRLTVDDARRDGLSLVVAPTTTLYVAAKSVGAALSSFAATGDLSTTVDDMMPFAEFDDVVGLSATAEGVSSKFGSL